MKNEQNVIVSAPKLQTAEFLIQGTVPYVQHKFSAKARTEMMDKQKAGSQGKTKKIREPKNFDEKYQQAQHISREGWNGIPAPAFRSGLIDACRLVGFKMTFAKMAVFVEADGFDADDGTPLVRIIGKPRKHEALVRLDTGVADIRIRPMWEKWEVKLRITFDLDQFSLQDVTNLLLRVGRQVGIGEGRPFSKNSHGQGWGLFSIESTKEIKS